MKRSFLLLFTSAFAFAQAPQPAPQAKSPAQSAPSTPGVPAPAPGQLKPRGAAAIAKQDPTRVVATVNGQKVTAEQALKLLQAVPANELNQIRQRGGGLPAALQQIFLMQHLSSLAAQQHMDQQEPLKTQIEFSKENILAQAYVNDLGRKANPSADEVKAFYDQHPQDFQEAKLSAIIVNFTPTGAPAAPNAQGARTEAQAKEKADGLVKKLRGGANFADLAKSDSDHKASADKGGELGTFAPDKLPKEISEPVSKLKAGEITDPIRESSAYYILKLESSNKKTFEQAQGDIVSQLKNQQVQKAIDQANAQYQVQVQDTEFFELPGTTKPNTPSLSHPSSPGQPKAPAAKSPSSVR
jgi:parvulin-like peptidyl-prolyl isomerase